MCTMTAPASGGEALATLQSLAGDLADLDAASLPAEELGRYIRELVQADAVPSRRHWPRCWPPTTPRTGT